jgi:probable HAF family extracellular repeat protein
MEIQGTRSRDHRPTAPGLRSLACAATLAVLPPVGGQCEHYQVTIIQAPDCPPFGPQPTIGKGLNDLSELVGYHYVCLGDYDHAFRWTPESGLTFPVHPPGMTSSEAWDVSIEGTMVGTCYLSGVTGQRGFVWDNNNWTILAPEGTGVHSGAFAVNAYGEVSGYRDPDTSTRHAFLWASGIFTDIAPLFGPRCIAYDLSDAGQVVGWMGTAQISDARAFLWQDGTMTDLGAIPGGFTSEAYAINDGNQIVGKGRVLQDGVVVSHPFLWASGKMVDLGTLPGFDRCAAADINDHQAIIGICDQTTNVNNDVPFLWQNGVMHNLQDLIVSAPGVDVQDVSAIDNQGQIAGTANISGEAVAVLLTPCPVPPGDLNIDCHVNIVDFLQLLAAWGQVDSPADLDDDGQVGILDLLILLSNWG